MIRSCDSLSNCFQEVFLDCKIAENVSLGYKKINTLLKEMGFF